MRRRSGREKDKKKERVREGERGGRENEVTGRDGKHTFMFVNTIKIIGLVVDKKLGVCYSNSPNTNRFQSIHILIDCHL